MGQCLSHGSDNNNRQNVAALGLKRSTKKQKENFEVVYYEKVVKSASAREPLGIKKKQYGAPRSSSVRLLSNPLLRPHNILTQKNENVDDKNKIHFVLVHGGGFGAWCWYKNIAILEENGFKVTAIDLLGSSSETNSITSISEYVKPFTSFLENLADEEKVILVGHDLGGTCISYAMELFPNRISKAVFVAATMLSTDQSTLDIFSQMADSDDTFRQAQIFVYANGNTQPPTAINFDKTLLKDFFFNKCSSKDVALASVSMKPMPFLPVMEKLSLSETNYGSVRRFYIETPEDNVIPITLQEKMIKESPPERVFRLKGADHSPFFSKPQTLHNLLVDISKIQ